MNKIAIITGTSRGIGAAIQMAFLENGIKLISINRNAIFQDHQNHLINFPYDLSEIEGIPKMTQKIAIFLQQQKFEELWIINNAASIGNIKRMEKDDIENMEETIKTNLISPMALTNQLLKELKQLYKKIRVLNVSSGAAFHPIHGLGPYCISKAGLEMFSKMLAIEYSNHPSFKSVTIGPGVVDTNMQDQIRKSNQKDFERLKEFKEFKHKGLLATPQRIAENLFAFMSKDEFESGQFYDVNAHSS